MSGTSTGVKAVLLLLGISTLVNSWTNDLSLNKFNKIRLKLDNTIDRLRDAEIYTVTLRDQFAAYTNSQANASSIFSNQLKLAETETRSYSPTNLVSLADSPEKITTNSGSNVNYQINSNGTITK